MSEIELPRRLIAAGEELWGDRVNVYQKTEIIKVLADALTPEEMIYMRSSSLSKLFDIPALPAWSGSFGIFLMSRQLVILKDNEMWILFAGSPIRFSLREFKIVTGLPCGKLPAAEKKKRKAKGKSVEEESYFKTLFDTDKDEVTVDKVLLMLKEKIVTDKDMRLRLACLVLVDGILVPTTHFPKCKVSVEHAEMVEDLSSFLSYPWGRVSFDMIMNSVKERDVKSLATSNVAVQGFFQALQMVVIDAVPELQKGLSIPPYQPPIASAVGVIQAKRPLCPFNVNYARVVDYECKVDVECIIRPEIVFDPQTEDLTWSDEEEDPRLDNMLKLIGDGYRFRNEDFTGGCKLSELSCHPRQRRRNNAKASRSRSSKINGPSVHGVRRSRTSQVDGSDDSASMNHGLSGFSELRNFLESMFEEHERKMELRYSEILAAKFESNNVKLLDGMKKWFSQNFVIDDQPIPNMAHPPATTHTSRPININQDHTNTNTGQLSTEDIFAHYASMRDENICDDGQRVNSEEDPLHVNVELEGDKDNEELTGTNDDASHSESVDTGTEDDVVSQGVDDASDDQQQDGLHESQDPVEDDFVLSEPQPELEVEKDGVNHDIMVSQKQTEVKVQKQDVISAVPPMIKPAPTALRKSKRPRVLSKKFGSQFQCDKRMRRDVSNTPSEGDTLSELQPAEDPLLSRINSLTGTIKLGSCLTLSARDLNDLLAFNKSPPAKVMDALMKFSRQILRSDRVHGNPLRVDVLDSKFVSMVCRLYPKFAKAENREEFVFPKNIVDIVEGHGDVDRVHFYSEADMLYVPFNFDKQHWVALAVDLRAGAIHVLDSNFFLRTDFAVTRDIQPFAAMLPYLFKQVSTNQEMSQVELKQFTIERILGVPQVLTTAHSGLMTVFLIQAHASGGLDAAKALDVAELEADSKKLVLSLLDIFAA